MATIAAISAAPSAVVVHDREYVYDAFEKIKFLGQGSYGTIYKVRHKATGQVLARKEICYAKMDSKTKNQLTSEVNALEKLTHPHIVQYHNRQHIPALQEVHIYMEYCNGGDLGSYIKKLKQTGQHADEQFVWRTLAQLVDALYLCHKGHMPPIAGKEDQAIEPKQITGLLRKDEDRIILHRDLKPENVFLTEGSKVKLGDFGLAKLMHTRDLASTFIGTPYYMCPEICGGETYCAKSDIWSLGVILYELCCRRPPFNGTGYDDLRRNILKGTRDQIPDFYSQSLRTLIESCMSRNPNSRPDVLMILRDPNVKLARYQLHIESSQSAEAETLRRLGDAHQKLQESQAKLEAELRMLRQENVEQKKQIEGFSETQRQYEIKWHASATLAIQQRVEEKVEEKRRELLQALEHEKSKLHIEFEVELRKRILAAKASEGEAANPNVDIDMSSMSLDPESPLKDRKPVRPSRRNFTRAQTTANFLPATPMQISPVKATRSSPPPVSLQSQTTKALLSPGKKAGTTKAASLHTPARQAPQAPRSALEGHTIIDLAKNTAKWNSNPSPVKWDSITSPVKWNPVTSPVKWDPEDADAPSPFLRKNTERLRW